MSLPLLGLPGKGEDMVRITSLKYRRYSETEKKIIKISLVHTNEKKECSSQKTFDFPRIVHVSTKFVQYSN